MRIKSSAWAFRGYNVTNLGRTPELLEHAAYGTTIAKHLAEGSRILSDVFDRDFDLEDRVRRGEETTLDTYVDALALIICVELAHVELLREFHGIEFEKAKMSVGYSLGEIAALIASNVWPLETTLQVLLPLAERAAKLAENTTMAIVFSRGPSLRIDAVERRCVDITTQGNGMISVSSVLSPNTVLVMGQGDTVDRFRSDLSGLCDDRVLLRKNPDKWPPIHTPIVWLDHLTDETALRLAAVPGGFAVPKPKLFSCVTGEASYNGTNARELLRDWLDHPQRLWDIIDDVLIEGVETVIHLGPEPNIIPATFARLSNNVLTQMNQGGLTGLGLRAFSRIIRRPRPWLAGLLSLKAHLLRAPFVEQVIAEDWLLQNPPT